MDRRSYIIRKLPKDNGEFREIAEPRLKLKALQRSVLRWLMARRIGPSKYAHAFVKNRSISTNAQVHTNKRVVIRVDIKDFFGSITKEQLLNALKNEGISAEDAQRIAEICTLNNGVNAYLPQGSPTSPFLSNLVLKKLDYRLAGLAKRWAEDMRNTAYTRYCDDMIFSSRDTKLNMILPIVEKFVCETGFKINKAKTLVMRNGNRQFVTGVVVNKTPNILRKEKRNFRAELHNIKAKLIKGENTAFNMAKLQGKAAFIKSINPDAGKRLVQDVNEIKNLLALQNNLVKIC